LEVAECLIAPIGDLGAIVGYQEKSAYHWRRKSSYRDAGDMPPRINRRLLAHAAKAKRPLTPEHLIWGAPYGDIEALLRAEGRAMPAHLRPQRVAAE